LTRKDRCDEHPRPVESTWQGRDPRVQRLYDRKWKARREAQLSAQPWCEDCLGAGRWVPAVDVHHVQRHQGDRSVFVTSPLKSLCRACHTVRTNNERKVKSKGRA
jgi:5-methylcytosine-specific restriction protein A